MKNKEINIDSDKLSTEINLLRKNSMVVQHKSYTIENVCQEGGVKELSFLETYQRRETWTIEQCRKWIIRLLSKKELYNPFIIVDLKQVVQYATDELTIRRYTEVIEKGYSYESLDSQNRVSAIYRFFHNKFSVRIGKQDIFHKDLSNSEQGDFQNIKLDFRIITKATIKQLSEEFESLNSGTPLNFQELKNANQNSYSTKVKELAKSNLPWLKDFILKGKGELSYNRLGDSYVINCLSSLIEYNSVSKNNITKMYENDNQLDNVTKVINILRKVFKQRTKRKGGLVDISWLYNISIFIKHLNDGKYRIDDYKKFYEWFMSTEDIRSNNRTILISSDKTNKDYRDCCRSSSSPKIIKKRLEFILKDFNKSESKVTGVIKLHNKRNHINKDIISKRIEQGIDEDQKHLYEADHVTAYAKGGDNSLENLKLLTIKENRSKGMKEYID